MAILPSLEIPGINTALRIEAMTRLTVALYAVAGPAAGVMATREIHKNGLTPKALAYIALLGMKAFADTALNIVFEPTPETIVLNGIDIATLMGVLAYGISRREQQDSAQIDNHEQI